MRQRFRIAPLCAGVIVVALLNGACATTLRDNIRKGALVAGESALMIDQAERDLYASAPPVYTAEKRKAVNDKILLMLEAVRTYERAARAWPENVVMPTDVPQALVKALEAILAVEHIVSDIPGNEKILANLTKLKEKIGG